MGGRKEERGVEGEKGVREIGRREPHRIGRKEKEEG